MAVEGVDLGASGGRFVVEFDQPVVVPVAATKKAGAPLATAQPPTGLLTDGHRRRTQDIYTLKVPTPRYPRRRRVRSALRAPLPVRRVRPLPTHH
jgi:hypothetical protein